MKHLELKLELELEIYVQRFGRIVKLIASFATKTHMAQYTIHCTGKIQNKKTEPYRSIAGKMQFQLATDKPTNQPTDQMENAILFSKKPNHTPAFSLLKIRDNN